MGKLILQSVSMSNCIKSCLYDPIQSSYAPRGFDFYHKIGLFPDRCVSWVNKNFIQKLEKIPVCGSLLAFFLGTILKIIGISLSILFCIVPCVCLSPKAIFPFIKGLFRNQADAENLFIYSRESLPCLNKKEDREKLAQELARREPGKQFVFFRFLARLECDVVEDEIKRSILKKCSLNADDNHVDYGKFAVVFLQSAAAPIEDTTFKEFQSYLEKKHGIPISLYVGMFESRVDSNSLEDYLLLDAENNYTHPI